MEIDPEKHGNESENSFENSEIDPIDKNTKDHNTNDKSDSFDSSIGKNDERTKSVVLFPNGLLSFEDFWSKYNKKIDRKKCKNKYLSLSLQEKELVTKNLPAYIEITDKGGFPARKNPLNYLEGECWNDDIKALMPKADINKTNDSENFHQSHKTVTIQKSVIKKTHDSKKAASIFEEARRRVEQGKSL